MNNRNEIPKQLITNVLDDGESYFEDVQQINNQRDACSIVRQRIANQMWATYSIPRANRNDL